MSMAVEVRISKAVELWDDAEVRAAVGFAIAECRLNNSFHE